MSEGDLMLEVEKFLYSLDDVNLDKGEKECNVFLRIQDVGSWILKFRAAGNILNRREIILGELVHLDAKIIFKSITVFHTVMIGASAFEDELVREGIDVSGKREFIDLFHNKVLHRQAAESLTLSLSNVHVPERAVRADRNINNNVGDLDLAQNTSSASSQQQSGHLSLSSIYEERSVSFVGSGAALHALRAEDEQPLKKGWLLKKRDILSGWKCRYFEVFPSGRLDYYADQNDREARGSVSLLDSDISAVKAVAVKRVHEYWGIIVETKNPEKTLRLASERTGLEGMVEATTWHQVLCIAKQNAERDKERELREKERDRDRLAGRRDANVQSVSVNKTVMINNVTALQNKGLSPMAISAKSVFSSPHGEEPPSTTQKLLYLSIILALSAVVFALYRSQRLSFRVCLALCALLAVLLLIFVQEFVITERATEKGESPTDNHSKQASAESIVRREKDKEREPVPLAVEREASTSAIATASAATHAEKERISFVSSDGDDDIISIDHHHEQQHSDAHTSTSD